MSATLLWEMIQSPSMSVLKRTRWDDRVLSGVFVRSLILAVIPPSIHQRTSAGQILEFPRFLARIRQPRSCAKQGPADERIAN